MKKIGYVLLVCAAVTLLTGFVCLAVSNRLRDREETTAQEPEALLAEQLEEALAQKDYARITRLVRENGLYTAAFAKYTQIADVYYYADLAKDYLTILSDLQSGAATQDQAADYIEYALLYGCIAVNTAESYLEEALYDNVEAMTEIADRIRSDFMRILQMTEEEIKAALSVSDGQEITEIVNAVVKRIY